MSWTPPGMVVSLPGLSGSSLALLGECSSSFCSEHFGTRSDPFCSFLGTSLASLTRPDDPDTCALSWGDILLELAHGLLSSSSSKLWGLSGVFASLSGGGDGLGDG